MQVFASSSVNYLDTGGKMLHVLPFLKFLPSQRKRTPPEVQSETDYQSWQVEEVEFLQPCCSQNLPLPAFYHQEKPRWCFFS